MIRIIPFLVLLFLLPLANCDNENTFIGKKVYLCNTIVGDTVETFRRYVYKRFIHLFKEEPISRVTVPDSHFIDSMVLAQHDNYTNCDTFSVPFLLEKCRYVVVLRSTIKIKYGTNDPIELSDLPIPVPGFHGMVLLNLNITDENPEYHYYNRVSGYVYDLLNKKRVYVFTGNQNSDNKTDTCYKCIRTNISDIFDNLKDEINNSKSWKEYQRLNHINLKH
jgi:hypothetical protein